MIAWQIGKKKQQSDIEKMSQISNAVTIKRPLAVPLTVKLDLKISDTSDFQTQVTFTADTSDFYSKCAGCQR